MSVETSKGKKGLRSKHSGSADASVAETRAQVEKLMSRIVAHVSYREAVRSEPKIIECLELYQQDMWDDEHAKAASAVKQAAEGGSGAGKGGGSSSSSKGAARATKKKRRESTAAKDAGALGRARDAGSGRSGKAASAKAGGASSSGDKDKGAQKHAGTYDFGELMKQAKTLQQFETTGRKPKKSKKGGKQQLSQRPETVDGSTGFRERSHSVAAGSLDDLDHVGGGAKKNWGRARRLSLPSNRSDFRAARYNKNSYDANGNPLQVRTHTRTRTCTDDGRLEEAIAPRLSSRAHGDVSQKKRAAMVPTKEKIKWERC